MGQIKGSLISCKTDGEYTLWVSGETALFWVISKKTGSEITFFLNSYTKPDGEIHLPAELNAVNLYLTDWANRSTLTYTEFSRLNLPLNIGIGLNQLIFNDLFNSSSGAYTGIYGNDLINSSSSSSSGAYTGISGTVYQDSNGDYYLLHSTIQDDGTVTNTYLSLSTLAPATPASPVTPVTTNDIEIFTSKYDAIVSGAPNYNIGDVLTEIVVFETKNQTIIARIWFNNTTGSTVTANINDLKLSTEFIKVENLKSTHKDCYTSIQDDTVNAYFVIGDNLEIITIIDLVNEAITGYLLKNITQSVTYYIGNIDYIYPLVEKCTSKIDLSRYEVLCGGDILIPNTFVGKKFSNTNDFFDGGNYYNAISLVLTEMSGLGNAVATPPIPLSEQEAIQTLINTILIPSINTNHSTSFVDNDIIYIFNSNDEVEMWYHPDIIALGSPPNNIIWEHKTLPVSDKAYPSLDITESLQGQPSIKVSTCTPKFKFEYIGFFDSSIVGVPVNLTKEVNGIEIVCDEVFGANTTVVEILFNGGQSLSKIFAANTIIHIMNEDIPLGDEMTINTFGTWALGEIHINIIYK